MKQKIMMMLLCGAMMAPAAGYAQEGDAQNNEAIEQKSNAVEQLLVYDNPTIYVYPGEIRYEPKTTGQKVTNAVVAAVTNADIMIEDEGMVAPAMEALTTAASGALRLQMVMDKPTPEQLEKRPYVEFSAVITGCNYTNRIRKYATEKLVTVTAFIYLKDMKTSEIVASAKVSGEAWAGDFTTIQKCQDYAIHDLIASARARMNDWYPLRGHMLEKGFEKGKKQKLKEIYIDLGSHHGLGRGYTVSVYTVKRIAGRIARRYIGRGTVAEVLGDDISSVTLKRGADLIKQAYENGAEIAVSAY